MLLFEERAAGLARVALCGVSARAALRRPRAAWRAQNAVCGRGAGVQMATLAATQLFVAAVAGDETPLVRAPRVRAARFLSLCAWRCNVTRQDEGCASRCEALAAGYTRQDAARDHIRSLAMNEAKSMSERLEAGRSGTRERRICYGHRTAPLLQGAGLSLIHI